MEIETQMTLQSTWVNQLNAALSAAQTVLQSMQAVLVTLAAQRIAVLNRTPD